MHGRFAGASEDLRKSIRRAIFPFETACPDWPCPFVAKEKQPCKAMNPSADDNGNMNADAEIREIINEWRSAICARDLDRLMKLYAPEVVFFDVVPPFQHKGAAAYRGAWESCLPHLPPILGSEIHDLDVKVRGELAVAHCFQRLTKGNTSESATCGWVRVTIVLESHEGSWRVVHEHVSVPFDPMTSKAFLEPGPGRPSGT